MILFFLFQLMLKSLNQGKSQGKSGVGKICMKATSCWSRNRMSARVKTEMIKRKASFTSMLLYFNDVKNDNFMSTLTEGFDEGDHYETVEREYKRRAEVMVSCNYIGCDEKRSSDGERMTDRISPYHFQSGGTLTLLNFQPNKESSTKLCQRMRNQQRWS